MVEKGIFNLESKTFNSGTANSMYSGLIASIARTLFIVVLFWFDDVENIIINLILYFYNFYKRKLLKFIDNQNYGRNPINYSTETF